MKLLYVQVLRAFAALLVAASHAQHEAESLAVRLGGAPFRTSEILAWNAGVDIFFVISGFIMVHASAAMFGAAAAPRDFLARRISRIVPLYWATTTLYLAIALFAPALINGGDLRPGFVLASYFFFPAMRVDGFVQPLYSLGWTLNYEMFFYVLFALALVLPRPRTGVAALIAALAMLVVAGRLLAPLPTAPAFWSDAIVLEFAAGVALGLARREGVRAPAALCWLLVAGGLTLLVVAAMPEAVATLPRAVVYGAPATLLVAAATLAPDAPGSEERAGWPTRLGVGIGDASYALYLVHPFAIRAVREAVVRSPLAFVVGPWSFVVVALVAALLVAVLAYRMFERPMTRRLRAFLEPRPIASHAAAALVPHHGADTLGSEATLEDAARRMRRHPGERAGKEAP